MRSTLTGTIQSTSAKQTAPSAAASQNSRCQSAYWVTRALIGSPSAPPTPSVALIRAIALLTRLVCSTSRRIAMPSGTTPVTVPCSARPMMMPTRSTENAAMIEPTTSRASSSSTMRRLPYMSPSRPAMGVKIADARRVAVTTQAVSSRLAFSSSGSCAWIGTTSVNMNEEARPANASTAMMAPCRGIRVRRRLSSSSREPIASGYRRALRARARARAATAFGARLST